MRAARDGLTLVSMEIDLTALDPADQPTVASVQALRVAAEAVDTPDFPAPCPYVFRGQLAHHGTAKRHERYVARADGEVAGYLELELPLRDNLENADAHLVVDPAWRRRGVGRALHDLLLERLHEVGRKRYAAATVEALPGGPARQESGRQFAAVIGAKSALDEVRRRLDLSTVDDPGYADLWRQARAKSTGYELVSFGDHTPDQFVADVAYLDSRLVSDAPMGELAWEVPNIDAQRVREREDVLRKCRWQVYSTGAVDQATGRMVALTAMASQSTSPWHAFQWITLVDPAHRGHRLGLLTKLENWRIAREQEPQLRVVDTWNAAVNQHMIAINEAMGFRPVDSWVNWQYTL